MYKLNEEEQRHIHRLAFASRRVNEPHYSYKNITDHYKYVNWYTIKELILVTRSLELYTEVAEKFPDVDKEYIISYLNNFAYFIINSEIELETLLEKSEGECEDYMIRRLAQMPIYNIRRRCDTKIRKES